jgi:tetratricopeptide (TPR) repeat protein
MQSLQLYSSPKTLSVLGPSIKRQQSPPAGLLRPCTQDSFTYRVSHVYWNLRSFASNDGSSSPISGIDSEEREPNIDETARAFSLRVNQAGLDPELALSKELGFDSVTAMKASLSEDYVVKMIDKLLARAEELEREKEEKSRLFSAGKQYYERGQYIKSREALEMALVREGALSPLGGEIQLWLALAYQANGQEDKCIDTYKFLESNHPLPSIRKQAAGLRYIMEAPKIKLRDDEKVQIPVFDNLDRNLGNKTNRPIRPRTSPKKQRKKTWDEEFWENYTPPGGSLRNRYVIVAAVIVAMALAWYSTWQ